MTEQKPIDKSIEYLEKKAHQTQMDLEVLYQNSSSFSASYQNRQLDEFGFSNTHQLGIRLVKDGREGISYSESLSQESLDKAFDNAKSAMDLLTSEFSPALQKFAPAKEMDELYNENMKSVSVEEKLSSAQLLESSALDFDERISAVTYNKFADFESVFRVFNSRGTDQSFRSNGVYAFAYPLAKAGEDTSMALEINACRSYDTIDPSETGRSAAMKAIKGLGAKRPKSGRYPILLKAEAARSFFSNITSFFSAKSVYEGLSPLKGKLGEKIFSPHLEIIDDPFYSGAFGSRPFDSEGAPSQKTPLVLNGELKAYLTNTPLARKMELPHTASASRGPQSDLGVGVSNFLVQPGSHTFDDMVSSHQTVLAINRFLGFAGFQRVSGDFSLQVEGELYQNGELVSPLKNFVLAGNAIDLMANVEKVGKDLQITESNILSPSILVGELSVSGE